MKRTSGRKRDVRGPFRQSAGVEVRKLEGNVFLAAPGSGTIHHLDDIASAAWRALAEPTTSDQLIELFQAAFPATPRGKIARDVANLLARLEEDKLIIRVGK